MRAEFKSIDEALTFAKTYASGPFIAFVRGWKCHVLVVKYPADMEFPWRWSYSNG
jgi:hypothetical protein